MNKVRQSIRNSAKQTYKRNFVVTTQKKTQKGENPRQRCQSQLKSKFIKGHPSHPFSMILH